MNRLTISTIALSAACLAVTGCRSRPAPAAAKASEPAPVRAALLTVAAQPFASTIAVTGTLVSLGAVEVKAETTGRVLRFPKEEGGRVEAGEAVIWVDAENYRLGVRQAESTVQVAEAALGRARVAAEHARGEFERARNLLRSGGITDRDYKAAEVAEKDAQAQIAVAAAQLGEARAALEVARKRLADTTVHAPVAGEIQHKHVRPGAYVEPPTPVFTLVDNRRLELESPVPTSDLGAVRAGQRVTFTVNAYPDRIFEGRVVEVNPTVDPVTRAAKVRIQVNNAGGSLKAGMFATGEIRTGGERQAILIPARAVYRDDQTAKASYVFVVEAGKAARRAVRIGREIDGYLEIVEGLRAGETLVAEQSVELADGVPVTGAK